MGRANRLLSACATKIACGYARIYKSAPQLARKAVHVGNPVRAAVRAAAEIEFQAPHAGEPVRLLVFGGSQGARIMSEVVPAAIERLSAPLRARVEVVQQARPEDIGAVRAIYQRLGVKADVAPFFADLPGKMAQSHLVIARSGASTVAELCVIGRPAVLVPLPHALDQDQLANAMALASAGGALLVRQEEFGAQHVSEELAALLADPVRLAAMATAARGLGRADAAERLADEVVQIAGLAHLRQKSPA
jgi:UDP-N-acetylglucosamine--N-acetylmuramyl-(pentapeptide) pyrophosphoryl-undecaprenol N-acetylglucosamine transferase